MSTVVYIDGQNFLYKVAEILQNANLISDKQDLVSIDIKSLLSNLADDSSEIRYYGVKRICHNGKYGKEISDKAIRFSDSLRRFKNYLAQNNIKYIPKGSLKVRITDECKNCGYIDYKFQEKGVDVGLAVDLVRDALENSIKHIILLSSDTDLLPALQIIKEKHVKLSYIAFKNQATISLAKIADQVLYLEKQQIIDAYLDSLN
ncbi:NYN domain-containing protein [Candidatus Saccharibacteria bacterium]|nr:NYN domain-containing protein [Candidatus Saccharibacteria bacterium]